MTDKRLIIVDVETTGTDPKEDRVVEIGGMEWLRRGTDFAIPPVPRFGSWLVDPGKPIPATASAVHHITDAMVPVGVTFDQVMELFWRRFEPIDSVNTILVAHNSRFDAQFVPWPGQWIDTYRCALEAWPDAPAHSCQVLRYWLAHRFCDQHYDGISSLPHRALFDVATCSGILQALLDNYPLEKLLLWSSHPALLPCFRFGKYANVPLANVPKDYLRWMSTQDFDEDVKFTVYHYLVRTA